MKTKSNIFIKLCVSAHSRSSFASKRIGKQPVYYPVIFSILTSLVITLLFVYHAPDSTAAYTPANIVRGLTNLQPLSVATDNTYASGQVLQASPWQGEKEGTVKIFENKIISVWGEESEITTKDITITYSNDVQSRGIINFEDGVVSIETIDGAFAVNRLREAIIATIQLAASENSEQNTDAMLFAKALTFLYEDNPEQTGSVDWHENAEILADLLINNCRVTRTAIINGEHASIQAINLPLPNQKTKMRAKTYEKHVTEYSQKYDIGSALIYAIMHTESNFNPHAVSPSKALGLMQVVPETAGQEVNAFLTGKKSAPSIATLLTPEDNIKFGTTYMHILNSQYFGKITNKKSRKLCLIAAYNAGPGAVLKAFSRNGADPIEAINALTPEELYKTLVTKMPSSETRRYVEAVTKNLLAYQQSI